MLPPPDSARHADEVSRRGQVRQQRIRWTVLASAGGRVVVLLGGLASVTLLVGRLGPERYGFWVALVSTVTLLSFADLGLGFGVLNRVAAATGREDPEIQSRRIISNAFLMLALIAVAGLLLLPLAAVAVPWTRWFAGAEVGLVQECAQATLVLAFLLLAALPFTTVQRVLSALQQGYWGAAWDAAGSLISVGALALAVETQQGLVGLAAAFGSGPFLAALGAWVWFFVGQRPALRPRLADWDGGLARSILWEGAGYLTLQLAAVTLASGTAFIVLHRCGAEALAHYHLVARLFQAGPHFVGVWTAALWPAYAEALARGDYAWVKSNLRRAVLGCAGMSVAGGVILVPGVATLVWWWTRTAVDPSLLLRVGLAVAMLAQITTTTVSNFLNAAGRVREQAWLAVGQVGLSLGAAWMLAGSLDAAGVAWGLVIGYFVMIVPAQGVLVSRVLTAAEKRPTR